MSNEEPRSPALYPQAERINPYQGFPRELIWIVRHPHHHNGPHRRFTAYPDGRWEVDAFTYDRSLGPFGTKLARGRWTELPDTDFASQRIHEAIDERYPQ